MLTRGTRTRTVKKLCGGPACEHFRDDPAVRGQVQRQAGYSLLPDQVVRRETADDLSDEFCFKYCVWDLDWSHASPVKSYKIHDTSDTSMAP